MTDLTDELYKININDLLKVFKESSGKIKRKIAEIVAERITKNKPFISIQEHEVRQLYNVRKYESYRRMEDCLGSHWSMNLIGLGLLVLELNEV